MQNVKKTIVTFVRPTTVLTWLSCQAYNWLAWSEVHTNSIHTHRKTASVQQGWQKKRIPKERKKRKNMLSSVQIPAGIHQHSSQITWPQWEWVAHPSVHGKESMIKSKPRGSTGCMMNMFLCHYGKRAPKSRLLQPPLHSTRSSPVLISEKVHF